MEIGILREFTYLAKNLNYTRTAEKCHISQPVLTRHIQSLEKELQAKLLERSKGDVRLTAKGVFFADNAHKIVSLYDATVEQMRNEQFRYDEVVRVGYLDLLVDRLLDEIYKLQLERFPYTKIELMSSWEQRVIELLEQNRIDIAIALVFDEPLFGEYGFFEIYSDHYDVLVSEGDPLAARESITIDDLSERTVLIPSDRENPVQYARIKNVLSKNEAIPAIRDTLFDRHDSVALTRAEYGVSLVRHRQLPELWMDGVRAVRLQCDELDYRVGAIWKRSNKNRARENFIEILGELVEK